MADDATPTTSTPDGSTPTGPTPTGSTPADASSGEAAPSKATDTSSTEKPTLGKTGTGKTETGTATTDKAATGKAATGKAATGKAATGKAATDKAAASKSAASTPDAPAEAGHRKMPRLPGDANGVRTLVARIVWGLCVVFALILATAALLIALEANPSNTLVEWVIARADDVDLGFFALDNPIKDFDKDQTDVAKDVKTALFNYGVAAVVWLVIGKLLDRVIRP